MKVLFQIISKLIDFSTTVGCVNQYYWLCKCSVFFTGSQLLSVNVALNLWRKYGFLLLFKFSEKSVMPGVTLFE